ncbi:hypothetical protein SQ11_14090 [Nitrosospira sp. NpAV]|nr:hypothetical protein SQ11_14090 [Nitrosospira sp. NpAV]
MPDSIESCYTASFEAMLADLAAWVTPMVQDQCAPPGLKNIGRQLSVVPTLVLRHDDFLEISRVESSTAFYIE